MIEDIISENLKVLRAGADLSQEKLAKKVGLTRQTINAIERKRKRPSKVQAIALYYIVHNTDCGRKILGDIKID